MRTNKKLLSRVLAMVLCTVMLLGSTGLAPAFAADGTVDGIDATLADDAAQSPGDGVDGTNGNGDDTIVPDGNGDDAAVPDIDTDDNAGNDPVPGDNEIIPDSKPDPELERQAALEALQAAYDAFAAEIDAERRYHADDIDHSCLYPDFDAFLARYEAAVTTGMDLSSEEAHQALMARFAALLSEAAVSAYLARGEMILVSDYDGMPGFDSDVGRMEGLKRYILDPNAVSDMDARIELTRQVLAERLENGDVDPENPENPDDPENPGDPENPDDPEEPAVPTSVAAVLDYYDMFCAGLPDMTFDQILLELDVLTGLIGNVMPEDWTESVALIEGYLPEIRSQQAMAEFVRRVNAIREQAAAGKYDANHSDFDRAAAQAEFDAVRALSQYMLDAELASENYANGLKILSNLEELMDAEPEPELSEQAAAFLDSVNRLQEEMQTGYADRPYSAIKAVDKLLTECSGLSATDLLDENVQAAKIALENMKRRIVVKPEILAFLQNVDILLFSANNGADLESEIVMQQAAAVVESMDVLTEADMENVEVVEAYQKLVEAGLVPDADLDATHELGAYLNLSGTFKRDIGKGVASNRFIGYSFDAYKDYEQKIDDIPFVYLSYGFIFFDYASDNGFVPGKLEIQHTIGSNTHVYASTSPADMLHDLTLSLYKPDDDDPDELRKSLDVVVSENYVELTSSSDGSYELPADVHAVVILQDGKAKDFNSNSQDRNWENSVLVYGRFLDNVLSVGDAVSVCSAYATLFATGTELPNTGEWREADEYGVSWVNEKNARPVCDTYSFYVVGRQISGCLTDSNGAAIANAELALFSYDASTDMYSRLERNVLGERIDPIKTDVNGNYLIEKLPNGDFYLAVKGLGSKDPVDNGGMVKVSDTMHGLTGWQCVTSDSAHLKSLSEFNTSALSNPENCLQNVAQDFTFEDALPPYAAYIRWGDWLTYPVLSQNNTYATYDFSTSEDGMSSTGQGFELELSFNETVSAGTELFRIPSIVGSYKMPESTAFGSTGSNVDVRYMTTFSAWKNALRRYPEFKLSDCNDGSGDSVIVLTRDMSAGSHCNIEITGGTYIQLCMTRPDGSQFTASSKNAVYTDAPVLFHFSDGLGNEHSLCLEMSFGQIRFSLDKPAVMSHPLTGNKYAALSEWMPTLDTAYGLTKEQFDAYENSNKMILELVFCVNYATATEPSVVFLQPSVSNNGQIIGAYGIMDHGNGYYGFFQNSDLLSKYDTITQGVRGRYFSFLAVFDKDEIYDVATDYVSFSCRLDAEFKSLFTDSMLTDSHEIVVNEPYTHTVSTGTKYTIWTSIYDDNGETSATADPVWGSALYELVNGKTSVPVLNAGYYVSGRVNRRTSDVTEDVSVAADALSLSFGDTDELLDLGPGDYSFSSVRILLLENGDAYYTDTGDFKMLGNTAAYSRDILDIYVTTWDDPMNWVFDKSVLCGTGELSVPFEHENVLRVRVVYRDLNHYVTYNVRPAVVLYADGPVMRDVVSKLRNYYTTGASIVYSTIFGAGAMVSFDADGDPLIALPEDHVVGAWKAGLNALSENLYAPIGLPVGDYPFRAVEKGTIRHGEYAVKITGGAYTVAANPLNYGNRKSEWNIFSYLPWDSNASSVTGPKIFDFGADMDKIERAEFFVAVPDGAEIVDVIPGVDNMYSEVPGVPEIDYHVCLNENGGDVVPGYTVLQVSTRLSYDRMGLEMLDAGKDFYFGGFRVVVEPRYEDAFTSMYDTLIYVVSFVEDADGNVFTQPDLWGMKPDDASYTRFDYIANELKAWFVDLDRNGNATESIIGYKYSGSYNVSGSTSSFSGLKKSVGDMSGIFSDTSSLTDASAYRYRLTYAQRSDKVSTDVILFDLLEDLAECTAHGRLSKIDLRDVFQQNKSVKVYINRNQMRGDVDSLSLVTNGISRTDLEDDSKFVLLADLKPNDGVGSYMITPPGNIQFLAFDFGDQTFQRQSVSIYMTMDVPVGTVSATMQNRAFFRDTLASTGESRIIMANTVTVDLKTTAAYTTAKTIQDYWITTYVDRQPESTGDALVGTVAPGELANTGWIVTREPESSDHGYRKLTLDKSGKPDSDFNYSYTMRYEMADPGKGKYNEINNLILYDEIESGSDSRYAGRLDNIVVTGQSYCDTMAASLIPDDELLELVQFNNDFSAYVAYVSYDGVTPDDNLPDLLVETTGRSDWMRISDAKLSGIPENASVTAIAVILPYMRTCHEAGSAFIPTFVNVSLNMVHGGKPNANGVDRVIKNGFTVGFTPNGSTERVVDARSDQTELEIVYKDTGVVLPVTGGPGVVAVYAAGMLFLVPAAITITRRTRRRQAR